MMRFWSSLLRWCHLFAVALLLVHPVRIGDPLHIDCAWHGLLQHHWNAGTRWGEDALFTYGPLGYGATSTILLPDGIEARALLGWGLAIAAAAGLVALARHLSHGWRLSHRIGLLLLAPLLGPSAMLLAIVAAGLDTLLSLSLPVLDSAAAPAARGRKPWLRVGAAMTLFAIAGCVKFTWLSVAVGVMALIALTLICMRRRGAALGVASLFGAACLVVWMGAGQRLGDLPVWLEGSIEIAAGYNETMSFDGDDGEILTALLLLLVYAGLAAWMVARRPSAEVTPGSIVRRCGGTAIALFGLFATFKCGFVRHDTLHAASLFGFAALMPLLLVAANKPVWPSRAPAALLVAMAAIAVWQLGSGGALLWGHATAIAGIPAALAPAAAAAHLEQDIRMQQVGQLLPRLRARVGDESVDLMGHQQGIVLWSGFQVRSRPVFQSYSAYTPYLQRRNAAFFAEASAPGFVIANVQSIDGHLPFSEDSAAWLTILDRYRPVAIEHALLLRRDAAATAVVRHLVIDRRAGFGEWVTLPDEAAWHELALDIDCTAHGRLVGWLYRPRRLLLDIRVEPSQELVFSVSPSLVRSALLLDPLIRCNADLVGAYLGISPPRARAFRLRAEIGAERHFRSDYGVRLDVRPAVDTVIEPGLRNELIMALPALIYPCFDWYPFGVEPVNGVMPLEAEPRNGVRAPAPCRLLFRWPGGRHRLTARFEILSDGRAGRQSDPGAAFRVVLTGEHQVVFERVLHPARAVADRGEQLLDLQLDLERDVIVALTTDRAPGSIEHCAWTAWRLVHLEAQ